MKYASILRHLADLHGLDRVFLTIYLAQPLDMAWLEREFHTIEKLLDHNKDEYKHFHENRRLAKDYLSRPIKPGRGLCLICCWALDLVEPYPLPGKVENLVWLDSSPYIRPLAEFSEEYETVALVVADNQRARIYLVSSRIEEKGKVDGNIKNHVRVGGWSQQRYERRRDKALKHYGLDVVEALCRLKEETAFKRLILAGGRETMRIIKTLLPREFSQMLVGEKALDLGGNKDFSQEIYSLFHAAERQAERNLWHTIKQQYLQHGLAAVGVAHVLKAAVAGRIDKILVNRDARIYGSRCETCGQLMVHEMFQCPNCGESKLFKVDMINELTEEVIKNRGTVDYCPGFKELEAVGHVAALLRY